MKTGPERDKAIERLLQRSRTVRDVSAAEPCPDAETLAAWVDGGLDRSAVALIEAHASNCARCQALLAAVAEASPELPAPAGASSFWHTFDFRWFVPLVAGAAAVILWVAAPNDRLAEPGQQANAALSKEVSAPPQVDEKADRFSERAPRSEPPAAQNEAAAKAENKTASAGTDERERDQLKDAAPSEGQAATTLDKVSPQQPAAPPAAADAGARAASPLAETVQRQTFRSVPLEITSPDPSIRWRLGPGGSVERTTDGGTSWQSVPTGIAADLTAGSSPAPSVCWLVGRAGTVLVSTDGRTWRRVAFPEMTDLAGVLAVDARTVTIITADGRRFRTADGGMAWTQ